MWSKSRNVGLSKARYCEGSNVSQVLATLYDDGPCEVGQGFRRCFCPNLTVMNFFGPIKNIM